jgi:hypothetical protein
MQALKVLAGPFLQRNEPYRARVSALLLDHVLLLPATRKLSLAALKALKKQASSPLAGAPLYASH